MVDPRDFRLSYMDPEEIFWADEYKRQILSGDYTNVLEYMSNERMGSYDPKELEESQTRHSGHCHALTFMVDNKRLLLCTKGNTFCIEDTIGALKHSI